MGNLAQLLAVTGIKGSPPKTSLMTEHGSEKGINPFTSGAYAVQDFLNKPLKERKIIEPMVRFSSIHPFCIPI